MGDGLWPGWRFLTSLLDVFGDGSLQSRDGRCQGLVDREVEASRRYQVVTADPHLHLPSDRSALYLLQAFSDN